MRAGPAKKRINNSLSLIHLLSPLFLIQTAVCPCLHIKRQMIIPPKLILPLEIGGGCLAGLLLITLITCCYCRHRSRNSGSSVLPHGSELRSSLLNQAEVSSSSSHSRSSSYDNLLGPIVIEGWLSKTGPKSKLRTEKWSKRYFALAGKSSLTYLKNHLYYFVEEEESVQFFSDTAAAAAAAIAAGKRKKKSRFSKSKKKDATSAATASAIIQPRGFINMKNVNSLRFSSRKDLPNVR